MDSQSAPISPVSPEIPCVFCGRPTGETHVYALTHSPAPYSRIYTRSLRITVPAHSLCFASAHWPRRYAFPLLLITFTVPFLLLVVTRLLERSLRLVSANLFFGVLCLVVWAPLLVLGGLYLLVNQHEKAIDAKMMRYYESHVVGDALHPQTLKGW